MRSAAEAAEELEAFGAFYGALAARDYLGDHICCAAHPREANGTVEDLVERGVDAGATVTAKWAEQILDAVDDRSSVESILTALGRLEDTLDLEPFARLVEQQIVHAAMLGALDSEWEREHEEEIAPARFAAETREGAFSSVPYADARALFEQRRVLPKAAFDALEQGAKRHAFTVARMASVEMLNVTKAELARQLAGARAKPVLDPDGVARRPGFNLRDFRRFAKERLESAGWTPANKSHVETVFRTNAVSALASGRFVEMRKPDVLAALPFWQIRGVNDSRARPTHRAAFGIVLPANDPFWRRAYPPFGWNCRCRCIARSKRWLDANRVAIGPVPRDLPDPGFDSGTSRLISVPSGALASTPPAAPAPRPAPAPAPAQRPVLPPPLSPPVHPRPPAPDTLAEAARRRREELEEIARRERELAEANERERDKAARAAAKASPSPMVSKAKALRNALVNGTTRARGIVRQQVEQTLGPSLRSQDVTLKRKARAKLKAASDQYFKLEKAAEARAWHHPITGEVVVREHVRDGAARALDALERGLYSDPRLAKATFKQGDEYLVKFGAPARGAAVSPIEDLNDLRTLVHEEMHGFSRLGPVGYRGAARVLEEVGTELNARHIVKNLTPEIAQNPTLAARFGSQAQLGTAAYQPWINEVCDLVAMHGQVSREAAGELVRLAHVRAQCQGGPLNLTPESHIRAFVAALDLSPERAQLIEARILSTHRELLARNLL